MSKEPSKHIPMEQSLPMLSQVTCLLQQLNSQHPTCSCRILKPQIVKFHKLCNNLDFFSYCIMILTLVMKEKDNKGVWLSGDTLTFQLLFKYKNPSTEY